MILTSLVVRDKQGVQEAEAVAFLQGFWGLDGFLP
jgi:hypothetical protein